MLSISAAWQLRQVVSLRTICRFVYHSTKKCDKYCSAITLNNYSLGSIKALKGGNIHKATIGPICTSKAIRHVTVWTAMGKALGPTVTDLKVNDAGMWYYQEGKAWVDKVLANMPNVETLTLVGCRVNILVTPTHQSIKTLRLSVSDSVVFGPVTWLTRHSIQTILRPFEGCPLEVIHIDNIAYDWTAMDEAVLKSKWPQLRSVVVGEQWSY